MKKKYYAVRVGRTTGIFDNWEECEASVKGYSGAVYKSFSRRDDAAVFLEGDYETDGYKIPEKPAKNGIIAYVDGSYDNEKKAYAYGCVLICDNGYIVRKSGVGADPASAELRNVTGEMLGAMYAAKYCEKAGCTSLVICYDYEGIAKWVLGQWQARLDNTRKYAVFMKDMMKKIDITFVKVPAHSGVKYNEEADRLAKMALR